MRLLRSSLISIIAGLVLLLSNNAVALTSTVTPAFARLTISTKQPQDTANIAITNNNETALTYAVSITDVDVATGSLLPKSTTSELTKQFLSASTQSITIDPKKSAVVTVTATNTEQLPPGGHYAALKIEPVVVASKTKTSNIQQAFSVPLFVIKEDGALRTLQASINVGGWLRIGTLPKAVVTLKNTGNVDGAPRGFVSYVRGSKTYSKQTFNDTSMPLFANQERSFEVAPKQKSPQFIGRYTTLVSYRLDGQEQPAIFARTSWFIPWWSVWTLLGSIIVIVIFVRKPYKKDVRKQLFGKRTDTTPQPQRQIKRRKTKPKTQPAKSNKPTSISDFGSTKGVK